jgi:hypothetical protein
MRSPFIPVVAVLLLLAVAALSFLLGNVLFGTIAVAALVLGIIEVLLRGWPDAPMTASMERNYDADEDQFSTTSDELRHSRTYRPRARVGAFWYGTLATVGTIGVPIALYEREYWWALLGLLLALGAGREVYLDARPGNRTQTPVP